MSGNTVTIDLPEDHYTIFNASRDGLPEIIVVNDGLLAFPHMEVFSWYLRVRLDAKELEENGMPTAEERRLLFEVGTASKGSCWAVEPPLARGTRSF